MINIDLYRRNWITANGISTIGWATWSGESYNGEAFHQLITERVKQTRFDIAVASELAKQLNGNYAIIIESECLVFLIADHIRSYPILYFKEGDDLYITDHLLATLQRNGLRPEVDICQIEVFLVAGLTLEDHTVFKNICAIQAAEVVVLNERQLEKRRYFIYSLDTSQKELAVDEEVARQQELFSRIFRRTLASAPNVRNWVLPLSGGHDSRMVINQLYQLGVKNIVCYSYGSPGNKQSQISREIASALGYPWYFVEYTPERWRELRESSDFNDYFDFAFNGVSDPHIQDFLAVSVLKAQGVIQSGDIFMPGHTFDFLTGAYCRDGIETLSSKKESYRYLSAYFNQWACKRRSQTVWKEFASMIQHAPVSYPVFPEYFHWQERHAKFIQNSVRVYEYFGFDWRTPLWDIELVDYWQQIPLKDKKQRYFLYLCEKNGLYQEPLASIPFDIEMSPRRSLKRLFTAVLPESVKRQLKFYLQKETPHSDDALYAVYAEGSPSFSEIMPYENLPKELRYYLKPYIHRPLYWFPDNDNNTLYALRDLFM
ncbi:asparagine synthase C-terminal domain-containing protein [Parabacteroides sp. PF5-9]|uniref:asparagine synthase C-terminal domain-containing protein n=1 Tax=Parabacteroides sp. PF5-9 TaxID=1742404 RepID=UPI00247520B2|nr:asparagine synthase C-terminal domain-containing protein [Parabacteroides sp. PF5-9]MDH6356787.1 asparagine synthase (glutamine-hydrolyzing) [Parabacteroides sp. PF5-9]